MVKAIAYRNKATAKAIFRARRQPPPLRTCSHLARQKSERVCANSMGQALNGRSVCNLSRIRRRNSVTSPSLGKADLGIGKDSLRVMGIRNECVSVKPVSSVQGRATSPHLQLRVSESEVASTVRDSRQGIL